MNVEMIKKDAISQQLGKLLSGVCKYSPETPAARGEPIEPDKNALYQFADEISRMAKIHFMTKLSIEDIESVLKDLVYPIAENYGHLRYDGATTGTWGVRISQLKNIIDILKIRDDIEFPKVGDIVTLYTIPSKIKSYEISTTWLFVYLEPLDSEINDYSISYNWEELYKIENIEKENK